MFVTTYAWIQPNGWIHERMFIASKHRRICRHQSYWKLWLWFGWWQIMREIRNFIANLRYDLDGIHLFGEPIILENVIDDGSFSLKNIYRISGEREREKRRTIMPVMKTMMITIMDCRLVFLNRGSHKYLIHHSLALINWVLSFNLILNLGKYFFFIFNHYF